MWRHVRFIGQNNNDNPIATDNVAANADGSILERLEYIQTQAAALAAEMSGAAGIAVWPAAAAYGNNVSEAEVLAYIQDAILAGPRCVEKTADLLTGTDPIFDVSGGPIKVIEITGIVTTLIVGASSGKLTYTTTVPAATVDLSAGAVALDDDAAGTSYQHINTTAILTPVTAGVVKEANAFATQPTQFLLPIGQMGFNCTAARVGAVKWYLRYVPLSPNSRVVAAA